MSEDSTEVCVAAELEIDGETGLRLHRSQRCDS